MLKDRQILSLKPKENDYEVKDANGLSLRVRPNGTKQFQYRYTIQKRTRRHTYGTYPQIGLAEVRKLHSEAVIKVCKGIDLNDEKLAVKQEAWDDPTLEQLAQEYYDRYLLRELKRPEDVFGLIKRNIIPVLGKRKAKTIKRKDLVWALTLVVDRGSKVTANRTLAAIKGMFAYAVERDILENSPAALITKKVIGGKETPRDRYLSEAEIKVFLETIDNAPFSRSIQLILKILLYTGKRISEVTDAPWSEFDWENQVWVIPKERTKNKTQDRVYLSNKTLVCLKELKEMSSSEWVCQSPVNDKRHIEYRSVDRAVKRHLEFFGFAESFHPHDLRRTVKTHLSEMGIIKEVRDKLLNHKLEGIDAVYDRAQHWEKRVEAIHLWEEKLKQILHNEKVIRLKPKQA